MSKLPLNFRNDFLVYFSKITSISIDRLSVEKPISLYDDLQMDADDLDECALDLLRLFNRKIPNGQELKLHAPIVTFEDLVRFVAEQPSSKDSTE